VIVLGLSYKSKIRQTGEKDNRQQFEKVRRSNGRTSDLDLQRSRVTASNLEQVAILCSSQLSLLPSAGWDE